MVSVRYWYRSDAHEILNNKTKSIVALKTVYLGKKSLFGPCGKFF